jgi:CBS domain containing-hemolysin-like protein
MLIAIQILMLLVLIALSAFFAGSETGVYRLSRFHLRLAIEQKSSFAALLGKVVSDSHALVFSILAGNNLANYSVTYLMMIILLSSPLKNSAELYATLIITPTLFIFGEVVPKNIYYRHANTLMLRFAPVLWFFDKLFKYSGIIFLLKSFSRLFASVFRIDADPSEAMQSFGKSHIAQILRETREEGILSSIQVELMNRLVKIPSIAAGSVMTPFSKVQMLDVNSTGTDLLEKLRNCPFTRLPVYAKSRSNVIGYVNIYRALAAGEDFNGLAELVKPLKTIPAGMKIIEAINLLKRENCKIVMVKKSGKTAPLGIITMKDLAEEITGELQQW